MNPSDDMIRTSEEVLKQGHPPEKSLVDLPAEDNSLANLMAKAAATPGQDHGQPFPLAAPAQQDKGPLLVLNLQPVEPIQVYSTPEISDEFKQAGIDYQLVTGALDERGTWLEIEAWVDAARVKAVMRESSVGLIGHFSGSKMNGHSGYTHLAAVFGCHFELIEIDELKALRDAVGSAEIAAMRARFEQEFAVDPECSPAELDRAARTSCALQALMRRHGLGFVAYTYEGQPGSDHEEIGTSIFAGNTLLTASRVPVAGEYEVKNVFAMKILDAFRAGISSPEFFGMQLDDDGILPGRDGPGHPAAAKGKIQLVPLRDSQGKPGKGLSIQRSVKNGPVTLLAVLQERDGSIRLLTAEGQAMPGPDLNIGNINSRYNFSIGARQLVNQWVRADPSHHCAIGEGNLADRIGKLGALLGIEVVRLC